MPSIYIPTQKELKDVSRVPLKLNKIESKNILHLQTEISVIVPSTNKFQNKISKIEMNMRVNEIRKYLSKHFGGYSSFNAVGGYVMKNGELVQEDVTKVTAFGDSHKAKANRHRFISVLKKLANKWGQESMGLEWEGDMYFVPQKFT